MFSAAYDWRLSYINLEERDRYFTKLKVCPLQWPPLTVQNFIETSHSVSGKKVVLLGHSMGSQVIFWFMKWYITCVRIL